MSTLNIRRWLFLFLTTFFLGGITILITSIVLGWEAMTGGGDTLKEMAAAGIWLFIVGLMFSVVSQMGFFAYLMVHRFGLGIFKPKLWNRVQIVLILFTFFDLIYLRYIAFAEPGVSWTQYVPLAVILLAMGLVVAFMKAKQTNNKAFIPTLFFIYVVTIVEVVPALTQNDSSWIILMLTTILVCNVWQVLVLHRLTQPEQEKSA